MGKPIIWSGTNAKLINSGDLVDKYDNSLTDGGKVTFTWPSHGLTAPDDIGRPVRVVSGNQLALADHTSAANAEVAGFVYDVIDVDTLRISFGGNCPVVGSNVLEGGGSVGGGNVYFLAATAGKITATEPTTVGYVSKPIAIGTATGSMFFINYRGSTVGSTNARTQISLSNNSTTNMQNCASYDAGSIEGWIYIDGTTDYRFYFRAPFSKYGAGGNYYISPSYVGDTPPAGFSITINSSGQSIVTMPSITGFVSATCTYSLNAPAVGTNFPLSIDGSQITGGTVGASYLPQVSTSNQGAFPSLTSSLDNATATQLGLKQYLHGTTYNGGIAPTVTSSQAGLIVDRAVFIPYQTQDGAWRLKCNVATRFTSATVTSVTTTVNGITSKNISNINQAISVIFQNSGTLSQSYIASNTNNFVTGVASSTQTGVAFYADIELNAKPTWAY